MDFDTLLYLGLVVVAAFVLSRGIVFALQKYLAGRKWLPAEPPLQQHFRGSLFALFLVIGLKAVLPFTSVADRIQIRLDQTLAVMLIGAFTWTLIRMYGLVKLIIFSRLDALASDNLRQRKVRTQLQYVEKVLVIFTYIISASLILMSFEGARKIGSSLIASAGVAGVVIGFAAQRSLSNLLAGFQLAFTQPIRIDDVVVVEGEFGKIEEITLTYVVVRIWDKRALILPITYFIEKPFQNWTRLSSDLLAFVFLYVDYSVPLEELKKAFQKFLEVSPLWDRKASAFHVTDTTEKSVQVRLLMGARSAPEAFDLRCAAREYMVNFIQSRYPGVVPQVRISSTAQSPLQ